MAKVRSLFEEPAQQGGARSLFDEPAEQGAPRSLLDLPATPGGAPLGAPGPEAGGIWPWVVKYPLAPLRGAAYVADVSGLAKALDAARRYSWAAAFAVGEKAGQALFDVAPPEQGTWQFAKEATATGEETLRRAGIVSGEGVGSMLAGIGLEIAGDPLNLLLVGQLTKGGLLVTKGTQESLEQAARLGIRAGLGRTWAAQAKLGQRALLQLVGRKTLVRGPRGVAALAKIGRGIAAPFRFLRTKSLNPAVRAVQEVGERAGADHFSKLYAYNDEMAKLQLELPPRMWEQVQVAAEYAGRDAEKFGQFAPEVQEWANRMNMLNAARNEVAERAGLTIATPEKRFAAALEDITEARGGELVRLREQMQSGLHDLTKKQKGWVDDAARLKFVEEDAVSESMRVAADLDAAENAWKVSPQFYSEWLADPKAQRKIRYLSTEYGQARHAAYKAHSESVQKTTQALRAADEVKALRQGWVPDSDFLRKLDADELTINNAMARSPNAVPRVLSREARLSVSKEVGKHKSLMGRVWTDEFSGNFSRGFVEDVFQKGEKGTALASYRNIVRGLSLDEVLELAKKPTVGTKLERYAKITRMSLMDRLRATFGRPIKGQAAAKLSRFYEMNPVRAFNQTTDAMIHAIQGTDFIKTMAREPDVFSDVAKAGWWKVSDIDQHLVDSLRKLGIQGERWLHPDLVTELTRTVTTGLSQGTVAGGVGQIHDALIRTFKGAVTVPERVAGRGIEFLGERAARAGFERLGGAVMDIGKGVEMFPIWTAYHFRNALSDFMLMGYNGVFNPVRVMKDGTKALRGKAGAVIDCGLPGWRAVPGAELVRKARAHKILFGTRSASVGGSTLGEFLENSRRVGYWVDRMRAGYSPASAALECRRVLFDYTALSSFERSTMRRVIPFWAWKRNIVKLNVQQMFHRPATIAAQLRLRSRPERDLEVPEWLRGRLAIALDPDKQTGEERFLSGIDMPVEDMMELLDFQGGFRGWVKQLAFGFNPLAKMGLAHGGDVLFGKGLDIDRMRMLDRPVRVPNTVAGIAQKTGVANLLNLRKESYKGKGYYTMDPGWEYFLRTVMARFYSTARAFEREDRSVGEKALRHLTGWGVYKVDKRAERGRRERRERERMIEDAQRRGDIRIKRIPYRTRGSELTPSEVGRLR